MGSDVIAEQHLRQTRCPVPLSPGGQNLQQIVQSPVKPFTLAVTGWMVRSGARLTHLIEDTQLLNEIGFKVEALIGMDLPQNPKLEEPLFHLNTSHSLRLLIQNRDCHCKSNKKVHHYQHVGVPYNSEQLVQTYCLLTPLTLLYPMGYINQHPWPVAPLSHQL